MLLILNCGSQSIKYKLFQRDFRLVKRGEKMVGDKKDYRRLLIEELKELKEFKGRIKKICHRVVHGGNKFKDPVKVTKKVLKNLKKCNEFAPLHNPYNILGIEISSKMFPRSQEIAVFDTGFYKDLPKKAFLYPIPEKLRKKYGLRRFGFHGISHEYAARQGAEIINRPFNNLKIISCHLGGGASITAIKSGKAIDTSMGFTPLEGLVMMTRPGDIDPGILLKIGKEMPFQELDDILNNFSGVKGICGLSDMKDVLKAIKKGNKKAKSALDIFVYRIQKYIGSYFALLNGCDLLIFTGAIGAGSSKIRKMVVDNLNILRKTKILAIETDEELQIAKKSKNL
jgi:acetate kinase